MTQRQIDVFAKIIFEEMEAATLKEKKEIEANLTKVERMTI